MVLPSIAIAAFNGIDTGRLYPLERLHPGHIAKLRRVCDVRDGRLVVAWSPSGRPSLRDNARHIKDPERRAILDELKLLRDAVFPAFVAQ